ncbi:hypothetical protein JR334_03090 [Clostridia bacterium]|nr:hypothetical protein JR334_03090 [Clostridia bacterium]
MLYQVMHEFPEPTLLEQNDIMISLYQPTHRHAPENRGDLVMFGNLLRDIESILKKKISSEELEKRLRPFRQLLEDREFWNTTLDGLAVLSSSEKCYVYKLADSMAARIDVAKSLNLRPLIRYFQTADRFQILGIGLDGFAIFEGNRYQISELPLDEDIPVTMDQVLGEEHTESYLAHGSYGGGGESAMFHGHGAKKDDKDQDIERYFRYIDALIKEKYSRESGLPLILLSHKEQSGAFRKISTNNLLISEGIRGHYQDLSIEQIKDLAWKAMYPAYQKRLDMMLDDYFKAQKKELATDNLVDIAQATLEGNVDILFLEEKANFLGIWDEETGEILQNELNHLEESDVLNDLATAVLKRKGRVVILASERIPGKDGVAARLRHELP